MTRPSLIDISQPMRPDIPVWPGDTPFSIEETWTISEHCPVRVSKMTLSTHTGTHADAHSHYHPTAPDAAARALTPYLGPCVVIDVTRGEGAVSPDEVLPALDACELVGPRVLLRTFEQFPHDQWPDPFRALSAELIDALGQRQCPLVGTDAPSIDPETSKTMDAHHVVHRYDMAILEGLVLDAAPDGVYELIALPLKIEAGDASPVRAILRALPDSVRAASAAPAAPEKS